MQSNEEKTESIVDEAKERFSKAEEFYSSSRQLAIADTRFAMGDSDNMYQWPEDIANERGTDKKVCLTVNLTAQHCNQIINEIRRGRPSCKVMPADDYADKKTAEILAGLIRNIQVSSSGDDCHDLAAEHAVYGGEGFWRVITEYESPTSFDQVIKLKACPNPQLVYIDPYCKEIDKSDAEWGFVFEDINKETFKREHPDIDPSSWATDKSGWISDDTFRMAEYFYCTYVKDKVLLLPDGSTMLESEIPEDVTRNGNTLMRLLTGETIEIIKERPTQIKKWKWCKLVGGHDKPIEESDWLGNYLPIISIIGKEININGEIIRKGLVRDLKDQARMANFSFSEAVQTIALQNKIPYMAAAESIKGWEREWGNANNSNDAYLPFNAYTEDGTQQLPRPERQQPATLPTAQIQMLQLSVEQMRAASGQQNANFGIKSEASSGVGIQRLKAQGEIATYHFLDNLSRGLRYEAKVLINLIQKYYDTKRVVRILGLDGKEEKAILDPSMQQPYAEEQISNEDIQKIFNPTLGQYDVVIDTGPSYQTQRQEAYASMTEIASRNPAFMGIAGDLVFKAADWPMSEEIAKRFEKTLPPELRDEKPGGAEERLAQITQEHEQMAQQMDMLSQQLEEAQMRLQQAESGVEKSRMELEVKRQMAELDAATQEKKMLQDAELKQRQMILDAEMQREKMNNDMILAKERIDYEAELAIYKTSKDAENAERLVKIKSGLDIAGKMALSHQENCAKVQMNEENNETKKEIAGLDAAIKLGTSGIDAAVIETPETEENGENKELDMY